MSQCCCFLLLFFFLKCSFFFYDSLFNLVLLNSDVPTFANSVDPDQLASKKPTDVDLHCLLFSM